MNAFALAALAATVLLGAGLLWSAVADRHRQSLQQRLKAVAAPSPVQDEPLPALTLRRRISTAPGGLYQLPGVLWAYLEAEFAATGNRIGIPHLMAAACVAGGAILASALYLRQLELIAASLVAIAAAPAAAMGLLRFVQARYRSQFVNLFPDALELICRAVRAGLPVNQAMAVAAREIGDPVGSELRAALSEMQIGVDPEIALQRAADRIRVPDFQFFVVAVALQRRTGGALGETLTNLSSVIRARKMLRLKARALSAETKASAAVIAIMPFIVGFLMYLTNPALMSVLFTDPSGRFMLGVAFSDLVAGIGVMVWIIRWSLR